VQHARGFLLGDPCVNNTEHYLQIVAANPLFNGADIARSMKVSPSRISQLANETGVRPSKRRPPARAPKSRVITGGVAVTINHTAAGTIGELLVAADLIARGYHVYAPLVRHGGGVDLVAISKLDCSLFRIEVRCAVRRDNRLVFCAPSTAKHDVIALVVTGEPVVYRPELPASEELKCTKP
jgi:hypothetical protein